MFRLTTTTDAENPDVHDIRLSAGRLVLTDAVSGPPSVEDLAQSVKTRLLHFQGENYLDTRTGVPWFQAILRKSPNLVRVRGLLRSAILSVPGIASVPFLDLDLDRASRTLTVSWAAVTDTGATIRSEDFAPLILRV